jgi:hypothetical protein
VAPVVTETQALALFREGRALLESHDYARAIPKLEESFRLDPGGGTRLNLALAYEMAGRTASAWTSFQDALAMAKRDARPDRVDEAQAHLRALQPRLSHLRVVVAPPARAPGLQVLRDGVALGEASWGVDVPVDPGLHRVEARAPGKRSWLTEVAVGDGGDGKQVTLSALADLPAPAPPRAGSGLRSMAWIAIAAGGVGLATAAATGAVARAKNPDCPDGRCSATAQSQVDTYNSLRTASTVSFWAGAGLAAAGLTLFLLSPGRHEDGAAATVVLAPRFVGLAAHF